MPSRRLPPSVHSRGIDPEATPMAKERIPVLAAIKKPVAGLKSPAANGRYGLLILSISISYSWLMPTMLTFMSNAEEIACHSENHACIGTEAKLCISILCVNTVFKVAEDATCPARGVFVIARRETEMTEMRVPSMVCGLVNLYSAVMKCATREHVVNRDSAIVFV